ncbi:MAG: XRE family transcriptional regulator [Lachnospiraceae bacterium]|nr:XRE family transcriptional regulator [Lachnospiraceae bacterium]
MGDMAKFLGTTTPFLSAVENGRKNVPKEWLSIISDYYRLSDDERKELEEAIEESKLQTKINMKDSSEMQRKVALQFARSFDEIDDETAERIIALLQKKDGGGE